MCSDLNALCDKQNTAMLRQESTSLNKSRHVYSRWSLSWSSAVFWFPQAYVFNRPGETKVEACLTKKNLWDMEKVRILITKGQLISECLFDFLNFPKKHRKIWQISAQEHERCWNHQNKDNALYYYNLHMIIWTI